MSRAARWATRRATRRATAAVLLALLLPSAHAQSGDAQVLRNVEVDWSAGALVLDLHLVLPQAEPRQDYRFQVEREAERLLPGLFMEASVGILYDSYRTVGERLRESQELFRRFSERGARPQQEYSRLVGNLREVQVRYRYPFYGEQGLAVPFVGHTRPHPMPRVLGFVPTRSFSGLVIDARGQLPAHGKDGREALRPALFPKLYDRQIEAVLSAEMCEPQWLRRWGLAAYSYEADEAPFAERIGTRPLRTAARGVFGIHSTDVILSAEAARRLLSLEANRRMLREGRILIIVDPPPAAAAR